MNQNPPAASALKDMLTKARTAIGGYYQKSTSRERLIIKLSILLGVGMLCYLAYTPIRDQFKRQAAEKESLERDLGLAPIALKKYLSLKTRQAEIQHAYRDVASKEAPLTSLESLITQKAGIPSGSFTIKQPQGTKELPGGYEQSSFTVKFPITDYPRLIDFLRELTQGPRPMILASLNLRKRPAGDALDIEMEVISMSRSQKGAAS